MSSPPPSPPASVRTHIRDHLAVLTLSRPEKRNAINVEMWQAIVPALQALADTPGVVAIAIEGDGEHFGAGADLREVTAAAQNPELARIYCTAMANAIRAVATCPRPVVAGIRGVAVGGAAVLAMAADLRICDDSSSIMLPFMRVGIIPDRFTLHRLLGLVGPATARRLLFGADHISCDELLRLGLVDRVVPRGTLTQAIMEMTQPYENMSQFAIATMKDRLLMTELGSVTALAEDLELMIQTMSHPEVVKRAKKLLPELTADK